MPIIGAHISCAGGVHTSIDRAVGIGVDAMMIFGSSPRQFTTRFPKKEDVETFKKGFKKAGFHSLFLHAPYLANLGSAKPGSRFMSTKILSEHMDIATSLGAKGLIFHVGSGNGQDRKVALTLVAEGAKKILAKTDKKTWLIMENGSGGGDKLGTTADEMAFIMKIVKSPRLKICVDTAHAFEAGLIDYTPISIKKFFDEWEKKIGKGKIVCLHANDSKTEFNSHHDRHENIGKGYIDSQGFVNLAKDPRVKDIPWLMEVPGYANEGPDKKNVDILRKLVNKK